MAAIVLSPTSGAPSTVITVTGTGFTTGGAATVTGITIGRISVVLTPAIPAISVGGGFSCTFVVPSGQLGQPGGKTVKATDSGMATASATFTLTNVTTVVQEWEGKDNNGSAYWYFAVPIGELGSGDAIVLQNEQGSLAGVTTSTTNVVLTDTNLKLPTSYFVGAYLKYVTGPAAGVTPKIISANTATTITTAAWNPVPTALGGDQFVILPAASVLIPSNYPVVKAISAVGTIVYSQDNQPLWVVWT